MPISDSFDNAKNFAIETAQYAAQKTKKLAAIAKLNLAIYAEEEKIKKAERELGVIFYRDYAVGAELDDAEYLHVCKKIEEAKELIAKLQEKIAALHEEDKAPCTDAPTAAEPEPEDAAAEPDAAPGE